MIFIGAVALAIILVVFWKEALTLAVVALLALVVIGAVAVTHGMPPAGPTTPSQAPAHDSSPNTP